MQMPYSAMAAALFGLVLLGGRLAAQQQAASAAGANKDQRPMLPAYVDRLQMRALDADELIAPVGRPLYSYADSARRIAEGAIWAWGSTGRPVAMAKCWKNSNET